MKRAKPPANTMIAEHANKISCISRRSRLRDGIPSKKRIATSYIQSYCARNRESGSDRRRMHKQILLLFRELNLTLPNLKAIDGDGLRHIRQVKLHKSRRDMETGVGTCSPDPRHIPGKGRIKTWPGPFRSPQLGSRSGRSDA